MPNLDTSVTTEATSQSGAAVPGGTVTINNMWGIDVPAGTTTGDIQITDQIGVNIPGADVQVVTTNVDGTTPVYDQSNGTVTWDLGTQAGGARGLTSFGNEQLIITVPSNYTQSDVTSTATITTPTGDTDPNNNESSSQIAVVCFRSETLIRTMSGNVPVQQLRVGDLVVTASGALRPIEWLGHRTIDCRCHPQPHAVMPVRVTAHAFGGGLPERDLFLSSGHPVLVGADSDGNGGHLVPIMCLINGTTIDRVDVDEVTYWHVALTEHDVLYAEGLPAESYIDLGSRPWFDGADGALYDPDMALAGMPGRCRPVAIDGPVVETERLRLDAVFAMRLSDAALWPTLDAASLAF